LRRIGSYTICGLESERTEKMVNRKMLKALLNECPHCGRTLRIELWKTSAVCRCGASFCLNPQASGRLTQVLVAGYGTEPLPRPEKR